MHKVNELNHLFFWLDKILKPHIDALLLGSFPNGRHVAVNDLNFKIKKNSKKYSDTIFATKSMFLYKMSPKKVTFDAPIKKRI
mgnify:CR=1 FL=1